MPKKKIKNPISKLSKSTKHKKVGKDADRRGRAYVNNVKKRLDDFKKKNSKVFVDLCRYLDVEAADIQDIQTKTEKELKVLKGSGGAIKTDLLVTVIVKNNKKAKVLKVSAKKTTQKRTSFHQYTADEFINVLKIKDQNIQELIRKHQKDGSAKKFRKKDRKMLTDFFSKGEYTHRLRMWVITGQGGAGRGPQIANCILKNDKFYCIEEYIIEFLETSAAGFGTGFSWTRHSKGKNKNIQLKG